MNLFNLAAKISLNDDDYNSKMKQATDSGEKLGNSSKGVGNKLLTMGNIIKGVAVGAVGALAGIGVSSIKVGMDFESSMSQVAATMGITVDEIKNGSESFKILEDAAKNAGATTQYSASQASEALNYLALAGYDASTAAEMLPKVLNLAAAGGMELASASDLVTDAMSALGLETENADNFIDQMAKTSQKSNTSVAQLGEGILTVGGTAKVLAGGTNELSTSLGILADNGIKGAEGGTTLRNMILSLTAPTDTAATSMKKLGLQVLDAEGNMRPMNEIFKDLDGTLTQMTQGEQTQVLSEIFNKTDLKGVNALLANSGERFDELNGYIADCDGAAANMAETMNDNLKGKMTILGSSLEGLGIQIYDRLEGPLKTATETAIESLGNIANSLSSGELGGSIDKLADAFGNMITKIAEGVEEWLPKIIDFFAWVLDNGNTIASIVVGIGTAMLTFNVVNMVMGLITAFKGVKSVTEAWAVAQKLLNLTMLANPIGIVIALVAGLVGGIIYLWNTNESFREAVIKTWNAVLDAGKACWEWLVNFFTVDIPNAWQTVIDFFSGIPDWFAELWGKVTDKFKEWGKNISNFFTEKIPELIEKVFNWFNELPEKIGNALGFLLGTIIQGWINIFNYFAENIPLWIENISNWFKELPGKIWTWLLETIDKVKNWGIDMLNKAIEVASNFISSIINWFSQLPSKIWTWLKQTIDKVKNFSSDLGAKAKEAGTNFLTMLVNKVKEIPSKMLTCGKDIVRGLWNGITSMGTWIADKVSGFFNGIVDGAKKAMGIHSPSRVFRDEVGKYMAQGVGVGFEKEMEYVNSDIQNSINTDINKNLQNYINTDINLNKPTKTQTTDDIIISLLQQLVNKNTVLEIDGREVMRATAPYQEEFDEYNSRNIAFA